MGNPGTYWFMRGATMALARSPLPIRRLVVNRMVRTLAKRPDPLSSELEPAGRVARGAAAIPLAFRPFAEAFESSYGARVLWVSADTIPDSGHPRLHITVLEAKGDRLTTPEHAGFGPSQPIRELLAAHVPHTKLSDQFGTPSGSRSGEHAWDDLHVVVLDFTRNETYRVLAEVTPEELQVFGEGLGLGKELWLVQSTGWWPVVFVHSDEQAASVDADRIASWSERYLELVRPHDDLGVVRLEGSGLRIDSKQNFDANFDSNWHSYLS